MRHLAHILLFSTALPFAALSLSPLPLVADETPAATAMTNAAPTGATQTDQTAEEQSASDRSWLAGIIEDKLSGEGRQIRLDGFKGAFSSRATFTSLTVSDDQGPWLTIRDGAMSWSRAAILTGKIEIKELSAAEIDLARLPETPASTEPPAPEAKSQPFTLPELPVSVNIGKLSVAKLVLGEPVLGEPLEFTLAGSLSLAGGDGKAKIDVTRTDGVKGKFAFTGGYANSSRQLDIDLLLDEGKGGIVSKLAGLPGAPALTLAAAGNGPLDKFSSDIVLSTDGQPRITGKVTMNAVVPDDADKNAPKAQGFEVAIRGDVTPLLPEEYREFFGTEADIDATGMKMPDGAFALTRLAVNSQALSVDGHMKLLPSGMPDNFSLAAKLGLGEDRDVLLPASGAETYVHSAQVKLFYDRTQSAGWTLSGTLDGLRRDDMSIDHVQLAGNGLVALETQTNAASGRMNFALSGIAMKDPALARAVGDSFSGVTTFDWTEGHPLNLTHLTLNGADLSLVGALSLDDLSGGVKIMPDLTLKAADLSRYAALAGQPALAGAIEGTLDGTLTALTGAFDLSASLTGEDLKTGTPQADALLSGQSKIEVSAARDDKGLTLRRFNADASTLSATASGILATGRNNLEAHIQLSDLGSLGPGYRGNADLRASIRDIDSETRFDANGTASDLALGQEMADKLLAGTTILSAHATQSGGMVRISSLNLQNPQLSASVKGDETQGTGGHKLDVSLKLKNAALLAPGFSGPVAVEGKLSEQGKAYALDLKGNGPGGLQATVAGTVASDFGTTDLAIKGRAETALANNFIDPLSVNGPLSFDLKLKGKPGLDALSGRIETTNARFTVPAASLALQNIALRADLTKGKVQLDTTAQMKAGGDLRLSGPIALSAPYKSDLQISFDKARFRDPELYDTKVSGALTVAGPLTGGAAIAGRLKLSDTEIRVPTAFGGAAEIPDIDHVHTPAPVETTLKRAGLAATPDEKAAAAAGPAAVYKLDVTVDAPNRIFVRGRGLDAELGGSLRITGTTANIVPIGHFDLIRGTLSVLAKRFTLTQGQVAMQGTLTPWILFAATTTQDDTDITMQIEGEATEPKLTLTSSPELPDDEILARLLFNKGMTTLSALQAAQLASAVATLAGKGSEGLVSKLRQNFGLDNLDVGTDDDGNASLSAGKYLSHKLYSDVSIDSTGQTTLNLNYDVNRHVTARGSVATDGDSSLGLFFDKDY